MGNNDDIQPSLVDSLKSYFGFYEKPTTISTKDKSALIGGGLLAGTGGLAYYDLNRVNSLANDWETALLKAQQLAKADSAKFVSPVTGNTLSLSPEHLDDAARVYYEGANNLLNKRILGLKTGTLYDGLQSAAGDAATLMREGGAATAKVKPIRKMFNFAKDLIPISKSTEYAGTFGSTTPLSHEAFYQKGTRADALAHHLREWWLKPEIQHELFPYALKKGDKILELGADHNKISKNSIYGASIKDLQRNYERAARLSKNPADKARFKSYLDFIAEGARPTSVLSNLAKEIGVTRDNFGLGTIYKGLTDKYNNTTDKTTKDKLFKLIKDIEDDVLKTSLKDNIAWEMIGNRGSEYVNKARRFSKLRFPAAGLGLTGAAIAGVGGYNMLNNY